jgi:hypothetical protein
MLGHWCAAHTADCLCGADFAAGLILLGETLGWVLQAARGSILYPHYSLDLGLLRGFCGCWEWFLHGKIMIVTFVALKALKRFQWLHGTKANGVSHCSAGTN